MSEVDTNAKSLRRGKKVKEEVEKKIEKLNDSNGVSTLGTFKSDEEISSFIKKRRLKR
ncbi:MAG: hypothetical protein QXD49_06650 [Archaeoglobaceae archaeon]